MDNRCVNAIRNEIRGLKSYTLDRPGNMIKLNQNESPFDLPQPVKLSIAEKLAAQPWNRYPELGCENLCRAGARMYRCDPGGIYPGNGSNEILDALFYALTGRGKTIVTVSPSYSMYPVLAQRMGVPLITLPLEQGFSFPVDRLMEWGRDDNTGLIMLCSPNNPTGNTISRNDLESVLQNSRCCVAVDEAYAEFSDQNFIPLIRKYDNLLIIRTASKALGSAGIRAGWILANAPFISQFKKAFLPYHMDRCTSLILEELAAGSTAMETASYIAAQREKVYAGLESVPGIRPFESRANFILFEAQVDAEQLFTALKKKKVLVRNVSDYPGLGNHLRVTIGLEHENRQFLRALESCMSVLKGDV